MQTFLQKLVDEIVKNHADNLSELCIIFPTRRAGLFFKKHLAQKFSVPVWSPTVLSIQDFIQTLSPFRIPDQLSLLFELFKVYKKYFPSESFDNFYPWGNMLLNDFNELDKYRVDGKKIFRNMRDIKKIESEFQLPSEELEAIVNFWKNFSDKELSILKTEFLKIWDVLENIYTDFKIRIHEKHWTTEGGAYRSIAEEMEDGKWKMENGKNEWKKIIFAGFYALSKSEESIIQQLVKAGKADVYWDADSYYVDDKKQEAGKFLRKKTSSIIPLTKRGEQEMRWKENHFDKDEKSIHIIGVPLQVGQAKAMGTELKQLFFKGRKEEERVMDEKSQITNYKSQIPELEENCAVVLPDENLLFPVLYSIPENIESINVTMGYPLRSTVLYSLFEALINLHKNSKNTPNSLSFYHKDVLSVLTHPYIQAIETKKIQAWIEKYEKNKWIRIASQHLLNEDAPELFSVLFEPLKNTTEIFSCFQEIIRIIHLHIQSREFQHHVLETEYIYHFYTQLKRLQDIIELNTVELDITTFWKLFKEIIYQTKIPFTGEPLKGLQIMGFLETRVLDFENLFILSVNEGTLPSTNRNHSFIPFSLRKGFGLPTFEEHDAITAYHFYRLLQRAKNIYLFYNTESKSITGGEKSRYILQIEHELKKKFPNKIHIQHKLVTTPIQNTVINKISIVKTNDVQKKLAAFIVNPNASLQYQKKFSASSLNNYINCPLQFYFRYIAGLQETEEVEDTFAANTFGSILHHAIEQLYANAGLQDVNKIEQLKNNIEETVQKAIVEITQLNEVEGKNLLLKKVIIELLYKILDNDKKDAPFEILKLEQEITSPLFWKEGGNEVIYLKGILDRVDKINDTVRIIDYKTGTVKLNGKATLEDVFSNPEHKMLFQTYFYAYLYWKNCAKQKIKVGVYPVATLGKGILYLNNGEILSEIILENFEFHLKKLIAEIFNTEIPFSQTEDAERCVYCAYKDICNR